MRDQKLTTERACALCGARGHRPANCPWRKIMIWQIRYLYRGRPGYLELTAPTRSQALRQARLRVKTIISYRQIRG